MSTQPGPPSTPASTSIPGAMPPDLSATIREVENIYRAVTGRDAPPPESLRPIPPEADALDYVSAQLDRLMSQLAPGRAPSTAPMATWSPPVCAWEADGNIVITVDVPGVPREAVEVTANAGSIVVAGQRATPWPQESQLHACDAATGRFRRMVVLPARARPEQMSAQMKDGVLEIRVPLAADVAAGSKHIPVK